MPLSRSTGTGVATGTATVSATAQAPPGHNLIKSASVYTVMSQDDSRRRVLVLACICISTASFSSIGAVWLASGRFQIHGIGPSAAHHDALHLPCATPPKDASLTGPESSASPGARVPYVNPGLSTAACDAVSRRSGMWVMHWASLTRRTLMDCPGWAFCVRSELLVGTRVYAQIRLYPSECPRFKPLAGTNQAEREPLYI